MEQTFTMSDGATTRVEGDIVTGWVPSTVTGDHIGNVQTIGGYCPSGVGYVNWSPSASNPTEKAFVAAKHLLGKKLIVAKTPQEFIAIVEELRSVL